MYSLDLDWALHYKKDFEYLKPSNRQISPRCSGAAIRNAKKILKTRKCFRKTKVDTNNVRNNDWSFHKAIAPVLFMAQCFGLMPVKGIFAADPSGLSFSWFSRRTLYSCVVTTIVIGVATFEILVIFTAPVILYTFEVLILSMSIIIASFNFLILARKWPHLMRKWHKIENQIHKLGLQRNRNFLTNRVRVIAFGGLLLSFVVKILFIISTAETMTRCFDGNFVEHFYELVFPLYFHVFGFSIFKLCASWIVYCLVHFIGYFMDVFIVMISIGLKMAFKSINDSLRMVKGQNMSSSFWAKHRLIYRNICLLCEEVDKEMSLITFVTFSNNVALILIEIHRCVGEHVTIHQFYTAWLSLIIQISRTLCMALYSSGINDESKRPLKILRVVPRESWCLETKRFLEEVSSDIIALTGMKLFHVTRGVILSVAGIIVTYELVIVQFSPGNINGICLNF